MPEPPKYRIGNDQQLLVDDLVPMSPGMRLTRSEEEFESLVNSIREYGVRDPIKTRPHPDEELRSLGKLEVLEGNRRVKACLHLGLSTIRGDVEDLDDEEAYGMAFSLNLNRENLTALAIANWLNYLQLKFAYSQAKLAQICGHSQSWVSRHLKMLQFMPKARPEQTGFTLEAEPKILPKSERQARAFRTAPEEIREAAMLEASKTGELPSSAELERRSRAEFTPEQVLMKYVGKPNLDNEFLVYILQEDAGLTITEAKRRVQEFRQPKRSYMGPKVREQANVWTKLSKYYPPEIIDAVSERVRTKNLEGLIRHCSRFVQKLYLKAPDQVRQAALEEWIG